jgi:hypothetical protein
MDLVNTKLNCRFCNSELYEVKKLGDFYSCGNFPKDENQLIEYGPLQLDICSSCDLVQLSKNFNPSEMYGDTYGYKSSLNESMVRHLESIADEIVNFLTEVNTSISHLDIGSNDGTLLSLVEKKLKVLNVSKIVQTGVDPSGEPFRNSYKNFQLIVDFFNSKIVEKLSSKYQIISSVAMLYDLPDINDFFQGIKNLLADSGIWISEQSYFFSMIKQNAFDTICHEHLEYYTVSDINNFCVANNLSLFDVKFNEANGGSFKFYVSHPGKRSKSSDLLKILEWEKARNKTQEIHDMFIRVKYNKMQLMEFLEKCKSNNFEVHGYGASTKGNTLLQYYGISRDLLPMIAERNGDKFGKKTPGTLIPIVSELESKQSRPYAYVVLPWHFKLNIIEREREFIQNTGTKFCFPLPSMQII